MLMYYLHSDHLIKAIKLGMYRKMVQLEKHRNVNGEQFFTKYMNRLEM